MNNNDIASVRVGPAGWSYDDWKGIVYPAPMPKRLHPLAFLSGFFDTVEINSSFYHPPSPKHCAAWARHAAGNPRFKFTLKLWERFTHQRQPEPTPEDARQFTEGIEPLAAAAKLGAVLIQFPWTFKRTPENRAWLARLTEWFSAYPLAIEVRHASWDRPEFYAALAERGIAFCNIDQPIFAQSIKPSDYVTARLAYVRLHGRNYEAWFRQSAGRDERYNYLYPPGELQPWIEKIENIRRQAEEVYIITNNHYRGQAAANAFEIQAALGKTDLAVPARLASVYPRLKTLGACAHNEGLL